MFWLLAKASLLFMVNVADEKFAISVSKIICPAPLPVVVAVPLPVVVLKRVVKLLLI